jgi:hypothetical protein
MYTFFVILTITLFSLIVTPGYKVFTGDQAIYIPQVLHSQNPLLFTKDMLTSFNEMNYLFFDELIALTNKIFNTNLIYSLFILSFVTRFIYYYSIYKIALYFSSNKTFSFLVILLFISGFNVYGYPYTTMETVLAPRLMGLSLYLLFLAALLNDFRLTAFASLILGVLNYPILSPPFVIFLIVKISSSIKQVNYLALKILFLLLLSFFSLLIVIRSGFPNFSFLIFRSIDPLWENIIRLKNPYYFISTWNYQLLVLLGTTILFFVLVKEAKVLFPEKTKKLYFYTLIFTPLLFLLLYLIAVEWFRMYFYTQLQIIRIISLWKIFSALFFSYFIFKRIKRNPSNILENFFSLGIISSFIFKESFIFPLPVKESLFLLFLPGFIYFWLKLPKKIIALLLITLFSFVLSKLLLIRLLQLAPLITLIAVIIYLINKKHNYFRKYQYLIEPVSLLLLIMSIVLKIPNFKITPDYYDDKLFMGACNWIKTNTSINDIFITEPFSDMSTPLRLSCLRNIYVSKKDGSLSLFDRNYAVEWKKRMDTLVELKGDDQLLSQLSHQYQINYVFSNSKLETDFQASYHNSKYYIYKLNKP